MQKYEQAYVFTSDATRPRSACVRLGGWGGGAGRQRYGCGVARGWDEHVRCKPETRGWWSRGREGGLEGVRTGSIRGWVVGVVLLKDWI